MTGGKKSKRGTPQGGVVSPLLANIYINRLLRHWRKTGRVERLGQIVSYADDFVIVCASHRQAEESLALVSRWLEKLGLTIHPTKTRLCHAREEPFDFLGYTFGPDRHWHTGQATLVGPALEESPEEAQGKDQHSAAPGKPDTLARTVYPAQPPPGRAGLSTSALATQREADQAVALARARSVSDGFSAGGTNCASAERVASATLRSSGKRGWSISTRRACDEGPCMPSREARPRAGCGRSASPVR